MTALYTLARLGRFSRLWRRWRAEALARAHVAFSRTGDRATGVQDAEILSQTGEVDLGCQARPPVPIQINSRPMGGFFCAQVLIIIR